MITLKNIINIIMDDAISKFFISVIVALDQKKSPQMVNNLGLLDNMQKIILKLS